MKIALAASILLNLLLAVTLAICVTLLLRGGRAAPPRGTVTASDSDVKTTDHLLLQVQCGKGDADACSQVQSMDVKGCDAGDPDSCVLMGISKQGGRDVPKDEAGAVTLFEKACAMKNGPGCWYAGSAYEQGLGVATDEARAIALDRQACDLGEVNGCLDLGNLLASHTRPPDRDGALAAWDAGCRLKEEICCDDAKDLRAHAP